LYDLTNTYFEGEVPGNPKAKHGVPKKKATDARLVTLGLVLDGSGFVRRSQTLCRQCQRSRYGWNHAAKLNAPPDALW